MAKADRKEFISTLLRFKGMPYVWGAQGLLLEQSNYEAQIDKRETSAANKKTAKAFVKKLIDAGVSPIYAFDCSGLIMYYVQNINLFCFSSIYITSYFLYEVNRDTFLSFIS